MDKLNQMKEAYESKLASAMTNQVKYKRKHPVIIIIRIRAYRMIVDDIIKDVAHKIWKR